MTDNDLRELGILRRALVFLTLTFLVACVGVVFAALTTNPILYNLTAVITIITGLTALTIPVLIENVKGNIK